MAGAEPLSQAEYDNWIPPAKALELFEAWSFDTAASSIATRLRHGVIRAVARRASLKMSRGGDFWPIHQTAWSKWACLVDANFWQAGSLTVYEPMVADDQVVAGEYFGVRFNPQDLHSLRQESGLIQEAVTEPAAPPAGDEDVSDIDSTNRRRFPRLPEPFLVEWHRLFLLVYPDGNATSAQRSVNGMFPRHHIARSRIRELFPDIPIGKPRNRKE